MTTPTPTKESDFWFCQPDDFICSPDDECPGHDFCERRFVQGCTDPATGLVGDEALCDPHRGEASRLHFFKTYGYVPEP